MSWLKEATNKDEAYWMARTQILVAENTQPRDDGHGDTDIQWVHKLVDEVVQNLPPVEGNPYDGNMRVAATVAAVLGLWFSQLQYAKTQDPNRPTFVRQKAYWKRLDWIAFMVECFMDLSKVSTYFPGQKWQDPWAPEAKGGDFL